MSSEISLSSELDEALNDLPSSPGASPGSRRGFELLLAAKGGRDRSRELPNAHAPGRNPDACKHEVLYHGICGVCGALVHEADALDVSTGAGGGAGRGTGSHIELRYLGGIRVRQEYLEQQHASAKATLLSERKLGLVLDLDHTLLHSKQTSLLSPEDREAARAVPEGGRGAMMYSTPHMTTRLRPGVFEFLDALKDSFRLFIYTMGDARYARGMAGLLDPSGSGLFLNRIIDRGDSDWDAHQKGLSKVCASDMTAIVDDTVGVWQEDAANVLRVQRYFFFQPDGSQAVGLPRAHPQEEHSCGQLQDIAAVLKRLHADFYESPRPDEQDVRVLLRKLKAQTLAGCHIVFSRVIDLNNESGPGSNPLWQLACRLGAQCSLDVGHDTTHIVALSAQTAKAQQGSNLGKLVVGPDWLLNCDARWTRVDESLHPAPAVALTYKEWFAAQRLEDAAALRAAGGCF